MIVTFVVCIDFNHSRQIISKKVTVTLIISSMETWTKKETEAERLLFSKTTMEWNYTFEYKDWKLEENWTAESPIGFKYHGCDSSFRLQPGFGALFLAVPVVLKEKYNGILEFSYDRDNYKINFVDGIANGPGQLETYN